MKNFTFQKRSKKNALASEGKSCRPETMTAENQYACHDLFETPERQKSHQSKRFPPEHNLPVREKEKKYWNKQLFGMR